MITLDNHAARFDLRMIDNFVDGVNSAHRNPLGQQDCFPLLVRLGQKDFLEGVNEFLAMLIAGWVRGKARIVRHRLQAP